MVELLNIQGQTLLTLAGTSVRNMQGQEIASCNDNALINLQGQTIALTKGKSIFNIQGQEVFSVHENCLINSLGQEIATFSNGTVEQQAILGAAFLTFCAQQGA